MSKKVYHIVDPETGKVVGEKRVGVFGQILYDQTPKIRIGFLIQYIGFLVLIIFVLLVVFYFLTKDILLFSESFMEIFTWLIGALIFIGNLALYIGYYVIKRAKREEKK